MLGLTSPVNKASKKNSSEKGRGIGLSLSNMGLGFGVRALGSE